MSEITNLQLHQLSEAAEESYKVLRANIQFYQLNRKIKTITVTSYKPNEGKSTTSINLGISMAKTGLNVLYVDADLRKPLHFKFLTNQNLNGLTNYLRGQADLEDIINQTDLNGFHFVNCGININNPDELFTSERFQSFLAEIEPLYDMIILDTPPLGSVIDGALIATQTDGTILVMESNGVKCKNALMMKDQLLKANANIIGVVLNKINKNEYKNYYGSYDYYTKKNSWKYFWKKWFHKNPGIQ